MGSKSCAQPVYLILIMSENQQGHGEIRVVPIYKFSVKQADHERNSRDMGIQSVCSQPYYALPS